MQETLYHGSSVSDIDVLMPRSALHLSNERVVYLTSSIPYALVYIWDQHKTGSSKKWVTCWQSKGITYYEEQFPGQLRAFYEGVEGYLYTVGKSASFHPVSNRENMYFSLDPVAVEHKIHIPDVYQELCKFQQEGKFKLLRFQDAAPQKQAELVNRIASHIRTEVDMDTGNEESLFFRKYFKDAWKQAETEANHGVS